MERRKKKRKTGTKSLIMVLVVLIIAAGVVLGYKIVTDKKSRDFCYRRKCRSN